MGRQTGEIHRLTDVYVYTDVYNAVRGLLAVGLFAVGQFAVKKNVIFG